MKYLLSVFAALLLVACGSTPQPAVIAEENLSSPAKAEVIQPDIDAHTEREALELILRDGIGMKVKRMVCLAQLPAQHEALNASFGQWFERNANELTAAKKYWAGVADEEYERVKGETTVGIIRFYEEQGDDATASYCANISAWISKGKLDLSRTAPDASRLAAEYLKAHPLTPVESGRLHFSEECTASALAKKTDLGQAHLICDCMAGELAKVAKDPAVLTMDSDVMAQLPSVEARMAVAAKTKQCVLDKRFDDDLRL